MESINSDFEAALLAPELDIVDNFPGWEKATTFLEREISTRGFKKVADIGGGANPLLGEEFIRKNGIEYSLLDISRDELNKAPGYYKKTLADITSPSAEFETCVGKESFDLIFSHMLLEHLRAPLPAHRNIHAALKPGGLAIHFFPSPHNLPLTINRLLPEWITKPLVRIAQPTRQLEGGQAKFPAYYSMCGGPSKSLHEKFGALGFEVVRHTGYIGHDYYVRFPIARDIERRFRTILLKNDIRLTSAVLLVLRKPSAKHTTSPK